MLVRQRCPLVGAAVLACRYASDCEIWGFCFILLEVRDEAVGVPIVLLVLLVFILDGRFVSLGFLLDVLLRGWPLPCGSSRGPWFLLCL
jgi:hypothetical protein